MPPHLHTPTLTRSASGFPRLLSYLILNKVLRTPALRTFFSVASIARAQSLPPQLSASGARADLHSRAEGIEGAGPTHLQTPPAPEGSEEHELYEELNSRFLKRLGTGESSKQIWENYSRIVEDSLEKMDLSIVSHKRLFHMLEGTPAPNNEHSKATLMTSLVRRLASSATATEYHKLAAIHEKNNDLPKLLSLANDMRRNKISPTTRILNSIIRLHIQNHDLTSALRIFNHMRRPKSTSPSSLRPDTFTYTALIRGLLQSGKTSIAEQLLQEMRESGLHPNLTIYNAFMSNSLRRGDHAHVLRLFEEMQRDGALSAITYRILLRSYVERGQMDEATEVLNRLEIGEESSGVRPDLEMYKTVVLGWANQGNLDMALSVMDKIAGTNHEETEIRPLADAGIYASVITLCCTLGNAVDAWRMYTHMVERGLKANSFTFNSVITALCTHAKDRTEDIFKLYGDARIARVQLSIPTFSLLVKCATDVGEFEAALEMHDDMKQSISSSKDADVAVEKVTLPLITSLIRIEKVDAATDLARAMAKVSTPFVATFLFVPLIEAYASKLLDWENSIQLYNTYQDLCNRTIPQPPDSRVCDAILTVACKTLDEPAKTVADLMGTALGLRPSVSAWITAVDTLFERQMQPQLVQIRQLLKSEVRPFAQTAFIVVDTIMESMGVRVDGPAVAGRLEDAAGLWRVIGPADAEAVLALIARRLGTGVGLDPEGRARVRAFLKSAREKIEAKEVGSVEWA
ncbi:hypothetical protein HK104_005486 [Borealophlyctis nickersoniae]|nr:hypothetical protein HK104_005486 [Borealophlyctis nickersoniae]